MSGALLQLASLSSQDVYITGNPEITLFKKTYLKYTNFSIETVQNTFTQGSLSLSTSFSSIVSTSILEKTGDLIHKIVLVLELSQVSSIVEWGYVDKLGHAIIDYIDIVIGGTTVDRQYGDFIDFTQRLNKDRSQTDNYNKLIGNIPELKNFSTNHPAYKLFIPLEFWTSKTTSSTFPILCLKNDLNFEIKITLKTPLDIINYKYINQPSENELPKINNGYILVDYIYLDIEERNLFLTNNHEYLIESSQYLFTTINNQITTVNLTFDKPTKYIAWNIKLDRYNKRNPYLAWAYDDKWDIAKDTFAKLIWLVTRKGLDTSNKFNPIINFETNYVNIGQVPQIITNGNKKLLSLANKVNGIILFAENINGNIVAQAIPDNVILTKNEITFEDMSNTINDFKDSDTTNTQNDFLDIYTLNIIEQLNYGNYINRTDNPIINSSLQLNGKNRFQERDGYFYNYIQPYYYFLNSPPDGVNVYTFSLHPEEMQPSGTLNFGYINSKDLIIKLGKNNKYYEDYMNFYKSGEFRVYAVIYNLLKIYNGQVYLGY